MGRITKDDRCLIKGLRREKNGGQTPNEKSFRTREWSVASTNRLTKKLTTAGQLNGSQAVAVRGF